MVAIANVPGRVARFVGFAPRATADTSATVAINPELGTPGLGIYVDTVDGAVTPLGVDVGTAALFVPDIYVDTVDGDPGPFGPDVNTVNALALILTEAFVDLRERNGTLVSTLDSAQAMRFQEALSEVGAGSISIPADDPVTASLTVGREIWCWIHATHVFTFRIEAPPRLRIIQEGEEAAQFYDVAGRGIGIDFDGARVYSPKGVSDPLLGQHRIYSYASIDFPNAGSWGPAIELARQDFLDPVRHDFIEYVTVISGQPEITETLSATAPLEWKVPEAFWIWGQSDTTPLGFNYFRKTITLAAETLVTIDVTADNYYLLWLDGTPILGDRGNEGFTWKQFRRLPIQLPAGTYTFAADVENIANGFTNPAAFLFAMYTTDDNGVVTSTIAVSDASWIALPYPASTPGWTPGQVILDAMAEAQARGGLTLWTCDFTATTDSHGNAWVTASGSGPYMPSFSIPTGASFLELLNALVAQGRIDWRVSPAGHVLQAFNAGEVIAPLTTFVSDTTLTASNIVAMESTPPEPPKTVLYVKWSNGAFEVVNATAVTAYGRIEGYATVDAPELGEATRQANVILADVSSGAYSHLYRIDPVSDVDTPTKGFTVGDYVTAPDQDFVDQAMRVWSISVGQTDMGRATFAVELNRRRKPADVENQELLQDLGRGIVGSTRLTTATLSTTNPVRR